MSQFISKNDYDATVHREILDAITRQDEAVVEICSERAISEMRCYLSGRYNCDKVFAATDKARNELVLMMCIDIAVYHLFCIHNPQKLSQMRKDRYERAVEWLKAVRKGDISVDGLPPAEQTEEEKKTSSPYQMRSNHKRINHF
jgi:phage gp36-like protein|nr:MAG TPA: head to tail adaptor [Caudoviricetes sp.]